MNQYNHYLSLLRILQTSPLAFANASSEYDAAGAGSSGGSNNTAGQKFRELVTFVAQVAQCYPEETKTFPAELSALILEDGRGARGLGNDTRKTIVQNLVMLRNKEIVSSIELLQTLFPLLPMTTSPTLRTFIRKQILTDIKTANTPSKNHKLNRVVQTLLFGMVEKGMGADIVGNKGRFAAGGAATAQAKGGEALWAVTLIKELWRKTIWNDAKTVSIVVRACQHPNVKVQSAAVHFFLGDEDGGVDSDDESDDEGPDVRRLEHQRTIKKKTKGDRQRLAKAHAVVGKKKRDKAAGLNDKVNFPALELLHDAQRFGEDLYENMQKHDKVYTLEHKITIMQLLSRVMGSHKLCVLGFYTYIIKYLTYHQLNVTQILVSLAQSVHDLTPPDVLVPIVHKLAHEFVHPGVGAEVIAAGLNSIREVAKRQPWCMEGEEDLLGDLIEYRKSKDKGVTTAARGLLQLFREVNPGLLKRRERGKAASLGLLDGQVPAFGHGAAAAEGLEGLELLEEHFAAARAEQGLDPDAPIDENDQEAEDAAAWQKWEEDSGDEDDSDSSGWENVVSDSDSAIDFSDSDDDEEEKQRRKAKKQKKSSKVVEEVEEDDSKSVMSEAPPSVATTDVEIKKMSLLAQQKILTPADFALLTELKLKAATKAVAAGGGTAVKRKLAALEAEQKARKSNDGQEAFLTETEILGPQKKTKMDYEERMAHIQKGREGREKFGSMKGKKNKVAPSSSTNREKARNKPIMMAVHSNKVMQKKKASLRDVQMKLRAAAEKQKKRKR